MPVERSRVVWAVIALILLAAIIAGAVYIWRHWPQSHLIEISLESPDVTSSMIYVGGAVNNPGYYPVKDNDNLMTLLQAAGGLTDNAERNNIRLYVPAGGETGQFQKVNINRAESWLLEALPGIGSTLSQRIVAYREQHGPFQSTVEITNVDGITVSLYEKIKSLITVTD